MANTRWRQARANLSLEPTSAQRLIRLLSRPSRGPKRLSLDVRRLEDAVLSSGCRFGVVDAANNTSSVYRLWHGRHSSDVYIAARSVAGELKASLHQTGQSHVALTSQRVNLRGLGATLDDGRYFDKWQRIKADAQVVRAFTIYFPSSELTPPIVERRPKPVVWLAAAPRGFALAVEIFFVPHAMSEAPWQAPNGAPMNLILRMPLPNGETVCAVTRELPTSAAMYVQLQNLRERIRAEPALNVPDEQWSRTTSSMRFILMGSDVDGSRSFVDAALPPPAV